MNFATQEPKIRRMTTEDLGRVMEIAADSVTLVLEGVQVVARLTSSEQLAMLSERRAAQFHPP